MFVNLFSVSSILQRFADEAITFSQVDDLKRFCQRFSEATKQCVQEKPAEVDVPTMVKVDIDSCIIYISASQDWGQLPRFSSSTTHLQLCKPLSVKKNARLRGLHKTQTGWKALSHLDQVSLGTFVAGNFSFDVILLQDERQLDTERADGQFHKLVMQCLQRSLRSFAKTNRDVSSWATHAAADVASMRSMTYSLTDLEQIRGLFNAIQAETKTLGLLLMDLGCKKSMCVRTAYTCGLGEKQPLRSLWWLYAQILEQSLSIEAIQAHSSFWLVDLAKEFDVAPTHSETSSGRVFYWSTEGCENARFLMAHGHIFPTAGVHSMSAFNFRSPKFIRNNGDLLTPQLRNRGQAEAQCVAACLYTRLSGLIGRNDSFPLHDLSVVEPLVLALLRYDSWTRTGISFDQVTKALDEARSSVSTYNARLVEILDDETCVTARGEVTWVLHRAEDPQDLGSPEWAETVDRAMSVLIDDRFICSLETKDLRSYLIFFAEVLLKIMVACCKLVSCGLLGSSETDRVRLAACCAWCEQTLTDTISHGRLVGFPALCRKVMTDSRWEDPSVALTWLICNVSTAHTRFLTYGGCLTRTSPVSVFQRCHVRKLLQVHEKVGLLLTRGQVESRDSQYEILKQLVRLMIVLYDADMRMHMTKSRWTEDSIVEFPCLSMAHKQMITQCNLTIVTSHRLTGKLVCDQLFSSIAASQRHPSWTFAYVAEQARQFFEKLGMDSVKLTFCAEAREYGHTWNTDRGGSGVVFARDEAERKRIPAGLLVGFHGKMAFTLGGRHIVPKKSGHLAAVVWIYNSTISHLPNLPPEVPLPVPDDNVTQIFTNACVWTPAMEIIDNNFESRDVSKSRFLFDAFICVVILLVLARLELLSRLIERNCDWEIVALLCEGEAAVKTSPHFTTATEILGHMQTVSVDTVRRLLGFWQGDLLGLVRLMTLHRKLNRSLLTSQSKWRVVVQSVLEHGQFDLDRDWIFNPQVRREYRACSFVFPSWTQTHHLFCTGQRLGPSPVHVPLHWSFPVSTEQDLSRFPPDLLSTAVVTACERFPGRDLSEPPRDPSSPVATFALGVSGSVQTSDGDNGAFDPTRSAEGPSPEIERSVMPHLSGSVHMIDGDADAFDSSRSLSNGDAGPRPEIERSGVGTESVMSCFPTVRPQMRAQLPVTVSPFVEAEYQLVPSFSLTWNEVRRCFAHFEPLEPKSLFHELHPAILYRGLIEVPSSIDFAGVRDFGRRISVEVCQQRRAADRFYVYSFDVNNSLTVFGSGDSPALVSTLLSGRYVNMSAIFLLEVASIDVGSARACPLVATLKTVRCDVEQQVARGSLIIIPADAQGLQFSGPSQFHVTMVCVVWRQDVAHWDSFFQGFIWTEMCRHPIAQLIESSLTWQDEPSSTYARQDGEFWLQRSSAAQQVFRWRAKFCVFSTMVLIATLARLGLIDYLLSIGELELCEILLNQGEVAISTHPVYRNSDSFINLSAVRSQDCKRILMFWQNGLYGLYQPNHVLERLKHVAKTPTAIDSFKLFCRKFRFDEHWFGHRRAHRAFRISGVVPHFAVRAFAPEVLRAFPRTPTVACHGKVDWELERCFVPAAMWEALCCYPGPAYVSLRNTVLMCWIPNNHFDLLLLLQSELAVLPVEVVVGECFGFVSLVERTDRIFQFSSATPESNQRELIRR